MTADVVKYGVTRENDRYSPWMLAQSGTEHGEQSALFSWVNRALWVGAAHCMHETQWLDPLVLALLRANVAAKSPCIPELKWLHAIPNGGERGKASAGNMKAEGVKSGVADMFWPVSMCAEMGTAPYMVSVPLHGLYIEMKRRNGKPSDLAPNQLDFREFVLMQGYAWCWARGWLEARDKLIAYATGKWTEEMGNVA